MKKAELSKTRARKEDDSELDCMCEAFCADDLSKVGSSDCSCSDCAEAMLEAYNQYLEEEGRPKRGMEDPNSRGGRTGVEKQRDDKGRTREYSEDEQKNNRKTQQRSTFNRSPRFELDKIGKETLRDTCDRESKHRHWHKTKERAHKSLEQQEDPDDMPEFEPEVIEISPTKYEMTEAELIFHVNQRIKQNLKKHRHKDRDERKIKQQEDMKKKLALAKLDEERKRRIGEGKVDDKKKPWNYQMKQDDKDKEKGKDKDQEEGEEEGEQNDKNPKGKCCHKIPIKKQTNSGMNRQLVKKIVEQRLEEKKEMKKQQIIDEKMKAEAAANHIELDEKPEKCEYDVCKKHHMNTSQKLINQTTKRIEKNAEKYLEKLKQQKQMKQEAQRLKESKLRALALKAQKKVDQSKKVGVNERTSFHSTIEHFSTFSEMRKAEEERKRQKQFENQLKEQINPNRGNVHYEKDEIAEEDGEEVDEIRKPTGFSKKKELEKSVSKEKEKKQRNSSKSESSLSRPPSKITKEMREQTLKEMEKSLGKRIKPRQLQQDIEYAMEDPSSKFYVWDMPLNDGQVKKIFNDAKIPMGGKGKNSSVDKKQKGQSEFREEVNRKIQQNIKNKLKEKEKEKRQSAIEDKVREKKQQIMKEYRKIKEMQTKLDKNDNSQNVTKSKSQIKSNKQLKSEFVSKINQKDKPKKKQEAKKKNIKEEKEKGIDLSDESDDIDHQNKATASLQENGIFTDGDKKIFVLNSEMLAGVKHLKV